MSDPLSWTAIALAVAGSATSAYGQIQQANVQKRAADYNAELADRNSTLARQQAEAQAAQVRRQFLRQQATAITQSGASGLSLEGSTIDLLGANAAQGQLDIETVKYNGMIQALGFESSAIAERYRGATAQSLAPIGATGTLLSGLGTAAAYKSKMDTPKLTSETATKGPSYNPMSPFYNAETTPLG